MRRENKTSWGKVSKWYGEVVGEKGHYFHQRIVLPGVLKLLDIKDGMNLLDIGCGQGVLARSVKQKINYTGIDSAKGLIEQARKLDPEKTHKYLVVDATKEVVGNGEFDRASIVLALQNMKEPEMAIRNAAKNLKSGGKLVIVLNHPSFRIPRQSGWGVDEKNKLQFRKVIKYMSPMEIPINMHPGKKDGPVTWSFHHPLEDYANYLYVNNFLIEKIEEWTSDKESEGKAAKMENRARDEFPMFMAISAIKK